MNSSPKLLVVDDDPELRELTQAYLVKNGFIVNTVETSVGMDEFLATNDVDLLILDLMLPGEHGLAIAKRLKKKKRSANNYCIRARRRYRQDSRTRDRGG